MDIRFQTKGTGTSPMLADHFRPCSSTWPMAPVRSQPSAVKASRLSNGAAG